MKNTVEEKGFIHKPNTHLVLKLDDIFKIIKENESIPISIWGEGDTDGDL